MTVSADLAFSFFLGLKILTFSSALGRLLIFLWLKKPMHFPVAVLQNITNTLQSPIEKGIAVIC